MMSQACVPVGPVFTAKCRVRTVYAGVVAAPAGAPPTAAATDAAASASTPDRAAARDRRMDGFSLNVEQRGTTVGPVKLCYSSVITTGKRCGYPPDPGKSGSHVEVMNRSPRAVVS